MTLGRFNKLSQGSPRDSVTFLFLALYGWVNSLPSSMWLGHLRVWFPLSIPNLTDTPPLGIPNWFWRRRPCTRGSYVGANTMSLWFHSTAAPLYEFFGVPRLGGLIHRTEHKHLWKHGHDIQNTVRFLFPLPMWHS